VLVRFDHVASRIEHADHSILSAAVKFRAIDSIDDCIRLAVPQPTEWKRIGNQINAALIFARSDSIGVHIHFLRNAAASFLITHRNNTQISHNPIRNPTTGSSNPMSFQKDLAPPGIYDAASAIAKSIRKRASSIASRRDSILR
jgi:hypothetical protein